MSSVLFPPSYQFTIGPTSGIYFEAVSSKPDKDHAKVLGDLARKHATSQFESVGIDPRFRDNYKTPASASKRIKDLERSARSDVPVGSYVINFEANEQDLTAIGVFILGCHQETLARKGRAAALLGRLGVLHRDSGSRTFTGWYDTSLVPEELRGSIADYIADGGIKLAEHAKVRELRAVQLRQASNEPTNLRMVEHQAALEELGFRQTDELESLRIEGREYPGAVYVNALAA